MAGDEPASASAAVAAALTDVFFGQTTWGSPSSGQDVGLVLAVLGIDEEVEAAVGVLHLGEEVRLPLRLLQDVGNPVAALGDAEVVQAATPGIESTAKTR